VPSSSHGQTSSMKAKTEELLNLLLWTADRLMRPTFRNLTDSYEGWAYRNGLSRQVRILEKESLLEARGDSPDERVFRLTDRGRLCALGGRDPWERWSRGWDGRWRMVLFDVPVARDSHRRRLRRYLHERGFGCLQGSVWVTPDPLTEEKKILVGARIDVASLLLLEAQPCAGESDAEIVAGAWDFERINQHYLRLMKDSGPAADTSIERRVYCEGHAGLGFVRTPGVAGRRRHRSAAAEASSASWLPRPDGLASAGECTPGDRIPNPSLQTHMTNSCPRWDNHSHAGHLAVSCHRLRQ
jgi:hypothetical protein